MLVSIIAEGGSNKPEKCPLLKAKQPNHTAATTDGTAQPINPMTSH